MTPYFRRVKFAFRTFFSILDHSHIPADIADELGQVTAPPSAAAAPPPPVAAPVETIDRAMQMLAILQRDGRLVDFLMEDLSAYQDAQVGAAVRDVHAGCRQALSRYMTLAPVLDEEEGHTVTVERGADAARVKIVGNVAGQPPYRGVLRHRGWEATRAELPPLPTSGRSIVAPAEIEVQ